MDNLCGNCESWDKGNISGYVSEYESTDSPDPNSDVWPTESEHREKCELLAEQGPWGACKLVEDSCFAFNDTCNFDTEPQNVDENQSTKFGTTIKYDFEYSKIQ